MKKLSLLIPLAVVLSGCGDSTITIGSTPPPDHMPDAFYAKVLAVVGTSAEDGEAPALEQIVATAPEDSEPQAL